MYEDEINQLKDMPRELELLYRTAVKNGERGAFREALQLGYAADPDNRLLAAWQVRLALEDEPAGENQGMDWKLAIPLALASGLLMGVLAAANQVIESDNLFGLRFWPLAGMFSVLVYLLVKQPRNWKLSVVAAGAAAGVHLFGVLISRVPGNFNLFTEQLHYQNLMMLNIPMVAWAVVGLAVLGWRSLPVDRFAFLRKSLEVFVAGGIFGAAMFVFTMVAFQLFNVIGVQIPMWLQNFMFGFIPGVVPMLAVALIYNPRLRPALQTQGRGLGGLVITLMRLLLPVTFLVLVIYIGFIPFNFMAALNNRDVLTIFNIMLFAVIALLIGATPVSLDELPMRWRRAMRLGILGVAALVVLVSLYAMSAVVYRTLGGGLTINRLAIAGWNVINIVILAVMAVGQMRQRESWVEAGQRAFSLGMILYPAWALVILLLGPALF